MKTTSISLVDFFTSLRFPLAILVVCIHADIKEGGIFVASVSHVFSHVAVPLFFMISGYFFFFNVKEYKKDFFLKKIKSRIRTLFVPYLIWNSIRILYETSCFIFKGDIDGIILWFKTHGTISLFLYCNQWNLDRTDIWGFPSINTGPIHTPLWFIRDLIMTVLTSPVIYYLIKKRDNRKIIVFTLAVLILLFLSSSSLHFPGLSATSLLFFTIGGVIAIYCVDIQRFVNSGIFITGITLLMFVTEVFFDGHNTKTGNLIYPIWIIIGSFGVLSLLYQIFASNPRLFSYSFRKSGSTFFIFVFHVYILKLLSNILNPIVCVISEQDFFIKTIISFLIYLLVVLCSICICLYVDKIFIMYFPCIYKIVNGRRK